MQRVAELVGIRLLRRTGMRRIDSLFAQGRQQHFAIMLTLADDIAFDLFRGIQIQAAAQFDVAALPVAVQRRQIVRRGRCQSMPREFVGPAKSSRDLLEEQHLVVVETELGHRPAHLLRHHAKIFAHDQAGAARTLKTQRGQQLMQRIVDIGAGRCGAARRNPPQTAKGHHMIEPQRAVIAHVVADQLDESMQRLRLQDGWIRRRNSPPLAF